ncbi:MAG: Riboflavin biosynthesis protein RibF [Parcubacteria group bacterium GW2011_GWD2_43_10]|uniref:riboflavin kinase n=4 Tax=Candidatus Vebleniibacteriota TaxID=1817921 RepID=A0A1G2Q9D2_9BACT|nr:MAG: Riboflavin biosynthesis protein RibF [Parcubacteria group bacterium GW2011_GWD1_42_9]KKS83265.1 MAG: Riboflavin biosynthesis protein RibF [Parcubacteria group bacterium GW2011_GWD2_43_10]OHA55061.1 MAG: hypothetical protein A2388_01245 [Candidatus Veblenbacteria bacterium RIFOXYB1_FULL_43_13]OHA55700.1 MAG: hypothetical protein A2226_00690 [Candidatus Veblenbacteria bacterium RIFOXYA2_FULL_43_9]OHA56582.1 MAG: hypothetical protein A2588_00145 [Candidatus Veblenbacteria bacterium RIFOXYD
MDILFKITGEVFPASQRGRTLGFPTANLNIPATELAEGIYLAFTYKDEQKYRSLLFIGSALTFNETNRKVEVFVLDKIDDWYGQEITVEALKKIRDNKKFSSADELVAQMKFDVTAAKQFFDSLSE